MENVWSRAYIPRERPVPGVLSRIRQVAKSKTAVESIMTAIRHDLKTRAALNDV